jgi:SAM-dependent methyltransferase
MSYGNGIMEHTLAYRLWQRPFQEQKFEPIARRDDLRQARRVLDVGCGPGTNAPHFAHADYLGIDFNEGYIAYARAHYGRQFVVGDVTEWTADGLEPFDFVFVNSFFHHVSDDQAAAILRRLALLVAPGGHLHVLDLVLPERRGAARLLARWDRGRFPRPIQDWHSLLAESYETVDFEPYPLTAFGATLWDFVYFKGTPRAGETNGSPAEAGLPERRRRDSNPRGRHSST